MPVDPSILGFSNAWYEPALRHAEGVKIDDLEIQVITAPYFLATKLEAFHGRGKSDFRSRDLEDIVTVVDGRAELSAEVRNSDGNLRQYLSRELSGLLSNRDFMEALPGHLLSDAASQQRLNLIVERMRELIRT